MPNRKAAIVVTIVFLLLVSYLVLVGPGGREAVAPTQQVELLALQPSEIRTVRVSSPEGSVTLTKTEEEAWHISAPITGEADQQQVTQAIEGLTTLNIVRSLPLLEASKTAEFGLEPAEFTVDITTSDGSTVSVEVGSHNPDGTKRYVRLSNEKEIRLVYSYELDKLAAMITQLPLAPTPTPLPTATSEAG